MYSASEKNRLLKRDAEWANAASEGRDSELILSFWTDDAVVIPPGQAPIVGKAALRQYIETSLQIPGFRISWTTSDVLLSPDENMAYLLSDNTVTMNDENGVALTTNGRAVTIWHP